MARRRRAQRRMVAPDTKYNSELVAHFINHVMARGKKSTAQGIVYDALDEVKTKISSSEPLEVLVKAIDNVKPKVEVKSRRVGGVTYQVPIEVDSARQLGLALRWLIQFSATRKGVPMRKALALEIIDAFNEQGNAIKKRDEVHKMAQANKAFAHYRW